MFYRSLSSILALHFALAGCTAESDRRYFDEAEAAVQSQVGGGELVFEDVFIGKAKTKYADGFVCGTVSGGNLQQSSRFIHIIGAPGVEIEQSEDADDDSNDSFGADWSSSCDE